MKRLALLPLALCSAPAAAQEAAVPEDAESDEALRANPGEILVIANRLHGQVDAPQQPIVTYDENDIAAYGASSLADLVAQTAPQTGSGRGRGGPGGGFPVMLFNGQRMANFREFRNFPTEAVRRMEVLPEEVALRYGYPPNQRVINFILKDNFASKAVDIEFHFPTRGGFAEDQFEATLLKINKENRLNLYARANNASMLTENERGVIQQPGSLPSVAGDPDPALFRSLVPDTKDYIFNASWTRGLGKDGLGGSMGLSAGFTRNDSRSISGLDTVLLTAPGGATAIRTLGDPLTRKTRIDTFQGGMNLNKRMGTWQLTATLDGSHARSDSRIDRRADTSALVAAASAGTLAITGPLPALAAAPVDRARATNDSLTALVTLAGRPLSIKAGDLSATVKAGFAYAGIRSEDTRSALGVTRLKRGDLSAGLNLGIPLASRKHDVLPGLGELSLNFSAGLNRLSDFGTLKDWSAGMTWAPLERLSLQASYLVNQGAPSLADLGNPRTVTFNVPVFDFTRGETVLATVTAGGNPALRREQQRDLKFSATWELPFLRNSNLLVEYFRNRSNDVTNQLPLLTPAIEAAFPGRATRDANGRLIAVDRRPVTLSRTGSTRLRWGLNLSGPIGKAPPQRGPGGMMGGMIPGGGRPGGMGPPPGGFRGQPGGPPPGVGGPGGGGPGGGPRFGGGGGGPMARFMGGGGGQGRWNLSIYHTVRFSENVLVAPGGPRLDLLDGDALSGGGVARHAIELEGGTFYRGFGLRFNGSWGAPTRVRGSGLPGTSDLRFGSVFKLDLRTFVNFDQQRELVKKVPLLKGARFAIEIENLFESRQRVTDASGQVPLGYQPDLIDPRGRIIGFEFRKMF